MNMRMNMMKAEKANRQKILRKQKLPKRMSNPI
jgi:hypothetical protein